MLTKFTKYSLFASLLLSFHSCDYTTEIIEMNQEVKMYQCDQEVRILSIQKGVHPCTYVINYSIDGYFNKKGKFELTLKNERKSYTKESEVINLEKGTHEIIVTLDQCVFEDTIIKSCFLVYK